eukprot:3482107-Prymnesium_polylepis.1
MLGRLKCHKCGHAAQDHLDAGSKGPADADLVDDDGKQYRVVFASGGGAHDAPEVKYVPM